MKKDAGFLLFYLILMPLFLSFVGIAVLPIENYGPPILVLIISILALIIGYRFGKRPQAASFYGRYLPVFAPLLLTVLLAAIGMVISKGFFGHQVWEIFVFALFPFLPNSFISALMGEFILTFAVPFSYYLFFLIGFFASERKTQTKVIMKKGSLMAGVGIIVLSLAVIGSIYIERSKHVLPPSYGFDYGNGFSSVDLEPYYVTNPNNKLPKLEGPASFSVETQSEMPILDGAEAAYPVYAAFANATYKEIRSNNTLPTGEEVVSFTNTIYAFERLVSGEVDIFFGAQPSASQQSLAESKGKELVLTNASFPIGVKWVERKTGLWLSSGRQTLAARRSWKNSWVTPH